MERLVTEAGQLMACGLELCAKEPIQFCAGCMYQEKVNKKLAAYEDTGLTPEEVKELADAKRDGLLVRLPCKVGDAVYEPYPEGVDYSEVDQIIIDIETDTGIFEPKDFNKIVFLTRAEAEAALHTKLLAD